MLHRKKIKSKTILKALRIVFLAMVLAVLSTIVICLIEKNNALASSSSVIFEVLSAINTVGLTLGLTPTLSIASKMVLIILMFVGRVGTITIAFAVQKNSTDANGEIEYEDSQIMVG